MRPIVATSTWSSCDDEREITFTHRTQVKMRMDGRHSWTTSPGQDSIESGVQTQRRQDVDLAGSLPYEHHDTRG